MKKRYKPIKNYEYYTKLYRIYNNYITSKLQLQLCLTSCKPRFTHDEIRRAIYSILIRYSNNSTTLPDAINIQLGFLAQLFVKKREKYYFARKKRRAIYRKHR